MKFSWPGKCRKWTVVWFEWPLIDLMEGGMGRKRSRGLVILAWRETHIQQEGPIKLNLYLLTYFITFSQTEGALNLPYNPNWFHCIYWLLYSPVYPPHDCDATLASISVQIRWEQQKRPLPRSNPHFCECPVYGLVCLKKTQKSSLLLHPSHCCQGWRRLECIPGDIRCKAGRHLVFITVLELLLT